MSGAFLSAVGLVSAHGAQDSDGLARKRTAQETAPREDAARQSNEIIVTGRRGEAAVPAESEFDEDDIAADGADTIQDFLTSIQPFIDPSGKPPVFLINGKPAGFDRSILGYPAGALAKVELLKPEAGTRYGTRSGTRVVNLVLKPKFASLESESGVNAATRGGQYGGSLGATRTVISGATRWNLHAQFDRQSALLKSARAIPASTESSNAVAGTGGTASFPWPEQYAPAASANAAINPADFETLQPATRNTALALNIARPLGNLSASLSLTARRSNSEGLVGLPAISPESLSEDGWLQSEVTALFSRLPTNPRALRNSNNTNIVGGSLALTGPIRGVQASFVVNMSYSNSFNRIENGYDTDRLKRLIHTENQSLVLNSTALDSAIGAQRSRSDSNNLILSLNLQKAILRLPAGQLTWSFAVTSSRGGGHVALGDSASSASTQSKYAQGAEQLSFSVPISASGSEFGAFRDLTLDLSLGRQVIAGGNAQMNFGGGLTWSPISQVELQGSVNKSRSAPSSDELNGPLLTRIDRIFDYATGEFVQPTWTTGGNPLLKSGSQTEISLALTARPLKRPNLALNFSYRQSVATDSPAPFPELTPSIEAAFPERIDRDDEGHLVAVDARPINIAQQKNSSFSSGLTLRLGSTARRRSPGSGLSKGNDPAQINFSVTHQLRLQNKSLIRRELPAIDNLAGSGVSRQRVNLRLGVGKRAFGGNLGVSWDSPTRVTSGDGAFQVTPPIILNLSSFADIARVLGKPQTAGWARGLKLSFNINNLLQSYRRVTIPGGSTRAGYSRDEVDPLGRTIQLTLRKQF